MLSEGGEPKLCLTTSICRSVYWKSIIRWPAENLCSFLKGELHVKKLVRFCTQGPYT
jgi:hypothetical protein